MAFRIPSSMLKDSSQKCMPPARLVGMVHSLPRPLVFASGVFDILHVGHVTLLERASQLGDSLVVALNSDASARKLGKPGERPYHALSDRARVVAALSCVSWVTTFDDPTPEALMVALRPQFYVKGADYSAEQLPEVQRLPHWGGRLVLMPHIGGHSSTALMDKMPPRSA